MLLGRTRVRIGGLRRTGKLLFAGALLLSPPAAPGSSEEPLLLLRQGVIFEHGFRDLKLHRYGVELAPGEYARIRVSQRGADMSVILSSPGGRKILEFDNPSDANGTKRISVIAEEAGVYMFEIRPREASDAAVGSYAIELTERRPATAEDRLRNGAEHTAAQAYLLQRESRPEDLKQALALYRKALATFRSLKDRLQEAATLYGIGMVHYIGNQPADAVSAFEQSLEIWREVGDRRQEGMTLNQIARTAGRLLGDVPRALAAFQEALPLAQETGDLDLQCTLFHNLAELQASRGDLPAAVAALEQALEIYRRRSDPAGEALIENALAEVYEQQGRPTEARQALEGALELARHNHLDMEAEALDKLGNLHQRLGQPHQALEYFLPALDRYGESHNFAAQGQVLFHLGTLLAELGEPEEGERLLSEALQLLRYPQDQVRTRLALSRIAAERGDAGNALRLTQEALAAARKLEYPAGEAEALRSLGFLHLGRGAARQGQEALEQALQRFEQIDSLEGQAETHRGLGQAAAALGDAAAADRSFRRALALARELGDTAEEARVLAETARSERAQGKLAAARASLEQSLDRLESLRSAISGDDLRASHFAAHRRTYEEYVEVLLEFHRQDPSAGLDARAFEAAERARARGLLDFLAQAQVDLREGDPALLAEEERLRLEMNAKAALRVERLRKPDKEAEVRALDQEIASLSTRYEIVAARLQGGSPRDTGLRQPEIDLLRIQRQVLDGGTVLLEYFLAEPHSVLWLVAPDAIDHFELPGRAEIERLARRVHEELGVYSTDGADAERKDLAALSRMLVGPVRERIAGKRLAVAADGALWYVPFAALPVLDGSGREVPLIAEHEVVQVPSAAVLRELRRSGESRARPSGSVAVLADPVFDAADVRCGTKTAAAASARAPSAAAPAPAPRDLWIGVLPGRLRGAAEGAVFERLPASRREAEAIAREAAPGKALLALDFQASRELATGADLAGYRVVHFATHGIIDDEHPRLSGLVLSQVDEQRTPRDGFLRLHDIYRMHLNADLVVLSGCRTALGKNLRGEGIVGLTHGFFHAGASQVLATLWSVEDRVTAELMQRFYRGLFHDGLSPSAALRQAQIGLWRGRIWRSPNYWAAYVLQGDWSGWKG
jgi:CHAT domain-containing protein/tetratricopeptide (TPR) repeat protein